MAQGRTRSGAPRLPGIGSHHSAASQSDDWLTPHQIVSRLGDFDLDPCASRHAVTVCAATNLTIDDDGLAHPWEGRVWLNPPYSEISPWMAAMAQHSNGIALVFARTETRWWQQYVWPHAHSILFLSGRIAFVDADTGLIATHNSGGPSALIAYSFLDGLVLRRAGLQGALVTAAAIVPGDRVSDLLIPLRHERHTHPMGGTHLEPDDGLFQDQPRM